MVIVEGPDGAGKTTLIEVLKKELGLEVAPRVVSKETKPLVNLQQWIDDNLDAGFQHMIFDRYRLISEPIYGPILRDVQQPGFDDLAWMGPRVERLYEIRPVIIYCLPPLAEVLKNLEGDTDNAVVVSKIRNIYTAYVAKAAVDYAHLGEDRVFIWNYTKTPAPKGIPGWVWDIKQVLKENENG